MFFKIEEFIYKNIGISEIFFKIEELFKYLKDFHKHFQTLQFNENILKKIWAFLKCFHAKRIILKKLKLPFFIYCYWLFTFSSFPFPPPLFPPILYFYLFLMPFCQLLFVCAAIDFGRERERKGGAFYSGEKWRFFFEDRSVRFIFQSRIYPLQVVNSLFDSKKMIFIL